MKDCQQAGMPCTHLTHAYHSSVHDMNSLMGNNQAMSNAKQKAESTGVFLSTLLLLRVFV